MRTGPMEVDWTLAEAIPGVSGGLPAGAVDAWLAGAAPLVAWAREQRAAGGLAFLNLPDDVQAAVDVESFCEQAPPADDVVITGIGGSALTALIVKALVDAPAGPLRRLHVLDTVDSTRVEACWAGLDPARTWLVGVSKSGGTLECRAVFHLLEARLGAALGERVARHVAVIAGEEENSLRRHARERGYVCLPIPTRVGGRFSALTAVGLLPAAAVGVSARALLEGARQARDQALGDDPRANPALVLAALLLVSMESGRPCPVLLTYGETLVPLGPWWVQLVAESLGQQSPTGPVGPTPLCARGPADQHSLLQLLIDGPDRHSIWFVHARNAAAGDVVPTEAGKPGGGHRLGEILEAEREATAYALAAAGRPVIDLALDRADARSVGAFLLLWEMAIAYAGRSLHIDPFGQPAVELGKQAASARLGHGDAALKGRMDALREIPRRRA